MRITLVLGSGGPVGHAFHCGVLHALDDELGWDARTASLIVGTSAGAQVAALLRAGVSAADLLARASGRPPSDEGHRKTRWYVRPPHDRREGPGPAYRPASTAYLAGLPRNLHVGSVVAALLPDGHVSLAPQAEGFRAMFGDAWPDAPLWIPAVDLHTGERVVFGREGAPRTDVGTAVAASGVVPGLCEPIVVEGRAMIDGGVRSSTNADLLSDVEDDLAIVSSPLSMFSPLRLTLRWMVRKHANVLLLEPDRDLRRVMGSDPMDVARAPAVADAAYVTTLRRLREGSLRVPSALRDARRST